VRRRAPILADSTPALSASISHCFALVRFALNGSMSRRGYGAGLTMVLESNVTAAIRANTLPFNVAPVFSVMA
jgi:hypothetical protein